MGMPTLTNEENPFSKMDTPEDVINEIGDSLEIFFSELPQNVEFAQEFIGETVNALVAINDLEIDENEKSNAAQETLEIAEKQFGKSIFVDEWRVHKAGILGEVCVRIALKDLGFAVQAPTSEDDLSKVDLWADPKETPGHIWAVQIKVRRDVEEPIVTRLNDRYGSNHVPELVYNEEVEIAQRMIAYLDDKKFEGLTIEPVIIWVPGGGVDKDDMTAFKRSGAPTLAFTNKLYAKIGQSFRYGET